MEKSNKNEETVEDIFDEVKEANEQEERIEKINEDVEKELAEALEQDYSSGTDGDILGDDSDYKSADAKSEEDAGTIEPREPILTDDNAEDIEFSLHADEAEEIEPVLSLDAAEDMEPELTEDDGEELEDEPLTEEEKAAKRKKRRKITGIVFGSILGVIAAAYLGLAVFFMSHFYFNTTINGVSFSGKSISDVEGYMEQQVQNYELALNESDGDVEAIKGADISLAYKKGDELAKQLKKQNPFLWPKCFWDKPEITASVGVSYDEAQLTAKIEGLNSMVAENQIEPVSALPEFNGTEFVAKEEVVGSKIDTEVFSNKIKEYIEGFQNSLDMTEEACYVKPKFVSDSKEVTDACAAMNKYMAASISYTFGSATEVVDKTLISGWLTTDENMAVTFNTDAVSQYIQELASKYNTYKTQRSFTSGNGNTVTVEGGDYGWIIDKDAEYEALVANIQNGEVVTKEPVYSKTAASHDGPDWGSTYVEIDLTSQYVWMFVNGSVVVSGPIVTGKPSAGDATPQGAYTLKYRDRDAVLRGPKQPDGSYEWESPVTFWMPFNGGIGLHDAPWQAAFGGGRYLTHGSRGCVNLQYSVAETIFNNVQSGTPVICHY